MRPEYAPHHSPRSHKAERINCSCASSAVYEGEWIGADEEEGAEGKKGEGAGADKTAPDGKRRRSVTRFMRVCELLRAFVFPKKRTSARRGVLRHPPMSDL